MEQISEFVRKYPKPKGYKSHDLAVDNEQTLLVCNLDYTLFQASTVIGDDCQEFEVTEEGNFLIVTEIE